MWLIFIKVFIEFNIIASVLSFGFLAMRYVES